MESALTDAIRAALTEVRDPQTGLDVVSAGWVQGLVARDGLVQFALEVPRERALWTPSDTFGWENHRKTLLKYMNSGRIDQLKRSISQAANIPLSKVEAYFQGASK